MASKLLLRTMFFQAEMTSNKTILHMNKSPITCYNIVADMNKYPQYVPWMRKVSLKKINDTRSDCEMTIGFPPITQSYISHVTLNYPHKIVSISNSGAVFETLESVWEFYPDKASLAEPGNMVKVNRCDAHYFVKFRFASPLYQNLSGMVFNMVFTETSKAFTQKINQSKNIECFYDKEKKIYKIQE